MKKLVMLLLLLILFQACSKAEIIRLEESSKAAPEERVPIAVANETVQSTAQTAKLMPEFKITSGYGKSSPPSINGTIKNIGNGTGDAIVTATVYYARVIAAERTAIIKNIKAGEDAKFDISFDKTTIWNSYKLTAEPVK